MMADGSQGRSSYMKIGKEDRLDLLQIVQESFENDVVLEGGAAERIMHLYEDGKMTFGEMRQILQDVFQGKTTLTEKLDGANIMVTYKDGGFKFARNKATLKEPMNITKLGSYFDGNPKLREAFVTSAESLQKALSSIEQKDLMRLFNNGQNFANIEIVYPPCSNILDYGNRCLLQINGVDVFDQKFNRISDDQDAAKWLYETLKRHDALKQEMFEITEQNVLRMKDSVNAKKALDMLMEDFDKLLDGFSLNTTIQDYANERLKRYILNVCNHNGVGVDRDCQFIKEMADRLNCLSRKRPTKSDIATFAKRAGVNVRGEEYRKIMETLETQKDEMNEEIMRPVESLVSKAGSLLLKNMSGFISADPAKTSQKLALELESTISEIEKDNGRLTKDKLKLFNKNMKKLENWKENYFPSEGVIIKLGKTGKCYKITGQFGNINQILHLLRK